MEKKLLHRRSFLKSATGTTVAAIAGLAHGSYVFAREGNVTEKMPNEKALAHDQMETRHLGENLNVSAIGLGCPAGVDYSVSSQDKASRIALIRKAFDNGVTYFDIEKTYGSGANEELVGEALRPIRHQVKISTKFGYKTNGATYALDSRPTQIRKTVEDSLRRLRTDYIDLVFQQRVDPAVPMAEVAETVKELIGEGKVLNWGLSEATAESIRQAHAVCPIAAIQSEYSIWWREPERRIFPTLEAYGIGFIPYGSLGFGYLAGNGVPTNTLAKADYRNGLTRFTPAALQHNMPLILLVQEWAKRKDVTPAQFALVWMLSRKPWIVPIPATTNIDHMRDFLGASIPRLTAWELEEFDQAVAKIELLGQHQDSLTRI